MEFFISDWGKIFMPEMPVSETALRGFLLYFFILFVLRILPRRTTGELGAMDLVFILLLTEAVSHSLGDFTSVGDGIIMLLVFIGCNYGINQLSYHFPLFRKYLNMSLCRSSKTENYSTAICVRNS